MSEPLAAAARRRLRTYLDLLATDPASLSSVRESARAWRVHVEDSLCGLEVAELAAARRIADVGSGAGFPGVVLAVALDPAEVDLIESVGRKCEFIRRATATAGIANARAVCVRAEDWAREPPPAGGREAYDAVVARAVGRLSTLAELATPLLREGGVLVAWKGRRDAGEEAQLADAAERLAMTPVEVRHVSPAGSEHRHLHVVRKVGPTAAGLPRRAGMAKKRSFGRPGGSGRGSGHGDG